MSVDRLGLWRAVDRAREARGWTWAQVAEDVGTSASTFTRLGKGLGTDADTFAAILVWLGTGVGDFVQGPRAPRPSRAAGVQLPRASAYLEAGPRLKSHELETLDSIIAAAVKSFRAPRAPSATQLAPVNRVRPRRRRAEMT